MRKLALTFAVCAAFAAAHAQLTGIHVFAGYGWSGSVPNTTTGSTHLVGPEIGFDLPLAHLTQVEFDFRADILLGGQLSHGSDLDGNVYRFLAIARTSIPGSKVSTYAGVGWASAQARAGEFASFNGSVTQLGVSVPVGAGPASRLAPTLEIGTTIAGKSGLGGYSICLGLHF